MAQVQAFNDGINIVGLMLARNEDWIIGASLCTALKWCDQVSLTLDRCTDRTAQFAAEVSREVGGGRIMFIKTGDEGKDWNEMDMRQENFITGRLMGGTHFAIIDADEMLTANQLPVVRSWFKNLVPKQQLQVPMVPVWSSVDYYRSDKCAWTYRNDLTLGFCDHPELTWKPREDGYHHHHRPPHGIEGEPMRPINWGDGGVMHFQFANIRRLLAKHVLYRMVDHLRWPERRTVEQLNRIYDEALQGAGGLTKIPDNWWGEIHKDLIDVTGIPWQEAEIRRLLDAHGTRAFVGLDLKGWA